MKKTLRSVGIALVAVMLTIAVSVREVRAGVVGGFATEWTQIMNNIQLTLQYEEQLQEAMTQIQQFQTQVMNLQEAYKQTTAMTQGLTNFNFGEIANDLNSINGAVQYGNSMAYTMANMDQEFNSRFPGYGSTTGASYPGLYRQWYSTNLDTAHAALKVTGLQYSQLNDDAALTQTLQQQSQNSTTLLQTMQVSNSMAAQEIAELEKLRQLIMTDIQSKATYQAQQASQAEAGEDLNSTFFAVPTAGNIDGRTYGPTPNQ